MAYIGATPVNVPSQSRYATYVFSASSQGQTLLTGADINGNILKYRPGLVRVSINGYELIPVEDYIATDGVQISIPAGINIKDKVLITAHEAKEIQIQSAYTKAEVDALVAKQLYNRILNPAMMISQENVSTIVSIPTATNKYIVDGVIVNHISDATVTAQQVVDQTPSGSPNRLRVNVTATDTSLSAGQWALIYIPVEGRRVADLGFGTSTPKSVCIRFGVRFPAGTYGVRVANKDLDRSWISTFTITSDEANTDVLRSFTIPGDSIGTWSKGTDTGLSLTITLAVGSTYHGSNGWQNGNYLSTSSQTNGLSAVQSFDLFDVGLYDASLLGTGVLPPFQVPDFVDELLRCQRYYEKTFDIDTIPAYNSDGTSGSLGGSVWAATGAIALVDWRFKANKRSIPVVTTFNPFAAGSGFSRAGTANLTAFVLTAGCNGVSIRCDGVPSGAGTIMIHAVADARL